MNKKRNAENCQGVKGVFHIYCQIPFRRRRCPYCSVFARKECRVFDHKDMTNLSLIPAYVKALAHEIEFFTYPERALQSIVFGGGTPTLLDGSQAEMIVETVLSKVGHLRTDQFCMSFETTPELATKTKLEEFRSAGFSRVSIGVESFLNEDLKLIGRANKSQDAFAAIDNARSAGYGAINIHLLAGFPGSTFDKWVYNLETAFKLDTECITINMMEYDYEGGEEYLDAIARRRRTVPSFDERVRMYEHALSALKVHGYKKSSYTVFCKPEFYFQYEVSDVGLTDGAICAFGPAVVSHLDDRIYQSLPFIREYIRQPFFKILSSTYKESVGEVIRGQLICYGAVLRDVVEPFFGCTLEEAINESKQAYGLVEDLISEDYAILDGEGLVLRENKTAAGLVFVWDYKAKAYQM